ncbi:beta-glucosidase [Podospora didyma]|uniref:beta-glucosidase n=1 Tax=Podospora didyma TaxID=330526 RepID=A0AAE0KL72_9PEZI|nr:beta-glucosidase [Podospora didyma]
MQSENLLKASAFMSNSSPGPASPSTNIVPTKPQHGKLAQRFPSLQKKRGIAAVVLVVLLIIGGGLAGLAALPRHGGGGNAEGSGSGGSGDGSSISNDAFFYGQSPPVYPSPNMTGAGLWAEAFTKAKALVGAMTLDEKIMLTSGTSSKTSCPGFIAPIPRLNFTGLCLADAGQGVRGTDFVSSWPAGIHVGASWNKALAHQRGLGMGGEFRTKGVNVLLGPVVGPVGRVVLSGRNWEGFSVDPYLAGKIVFETVQAVQSVGVMASTKHFIGNEQETNRVPSGGIEAVSSNIDDKTLHELYLWPFMDAVKAGTGGIMCSYQRLNNSYGCSNSKALNGLLKTELGFEGFVVTDWGAQHAGVDTALAGLDMAMPTGDTFWGSHLATAIKNGSVPQSRLDDMASRILASYYKSSQDRGYPSPGVGMASDLTKAHTVVDARNSSFRSTLLDGAVEGHVLVKNIRNALPLKSPKMLSIFGYSARNSDVNTPGGIISSWLWGAQSNDIMELLTGFGGSGKVGKTSISFNGTLIAGGGSGAPSQSYVSAPFDAIAQQAYDDGTALFWDLTSAKPFANPNSEACLVFGNAWATEGQDRPGMHDDYTDGLIKHIANQCNNTIVVLHNAGIRLVDQFIDHPNVTAVLFAHLPGELSGRALTSILYGKSNPSGRLPYTIARNETDYPVLGPDLPQGQFLKFPQSNFSEGTLLDYRHFDAKNITPRYEFGFGLSYTTFNYSNLAIEKANTTSSGNSTALFAEYPSGAVREGGPTDLWDVLFRVSADITNVGNADGAEVAQLYVGIPGSDSVRQLRGFEKPFINATETATVRFELTRRDLSVWDTNAQKWKLGSGKYNITVGRSSRDLPLVGEVVI